MSYADDYVLRTSPTLLARFLVAVEIAACGIWGEAGTTTNHANRILWAQRALFTTDKAQYYANLMLRIAAASNAAFQSTGESTTDAAIQSLVNNYADLMATAGY